MCVSQIEDAEEDKRNAGKVKELMSSTMTNPASAETSSVTGTFGVFGESANTSTSGVMQDESQVVNTCVVLVNDNWNYN